MLLSTLSPLSHDKHHLWLPYTQMKTELPPEQVVQTQGSTLTLADGRVLVDGIASWWTACHGYNHPYIRAKTTEQFQSMPHVMFGGLVHDPALRLASRLSKILPGDLGRVFFSESGSIAVEVAMKIALQYWINQGYPGKNRFIYLKNGYHGDTLATMAICDPNEGIHTIFKSTFPPHFMAEKPETQNEKTAFTNLLTAHQNNIAAIILEPLVQGAGGMKFYEPDTLYFIYKQAQHHGVLLIVDEIFTGFGRTGTMFASEQADILPDIICLSKALTAGTMPLAATIARPYIFNRFLSDNASHALMHGPTYMANPLACACANASLDLFEKLPRLREVSKINDQLAYELKKCAALPSVRSVRVKGAIGVVELHSINQINRLKKAFLEHGVWIRPFLNVVYVTPAFTITEKELLHLTDAIYEILHQGPY